MTAPQLGLFAPTNRAVPTPAPVHSPPILRPYQVGALDGGTVDGEAWPGIRAQHREHRATLAVLSTGLGKTVLFAEEARRQGGALVLAHRDSLIRQAADKLREATGEHIAIEKAERTAWGGSYVCASVQTLKGRRLEAFAERFKDLPLIVIDEGHRGTAPSYRAIVAAFPGAKVLYVTATADRSDGVGLYNVAESVAYRYEGRAPCDDGWLLFPDMRPVDVRDIDLGKIKIRNGDLDQGQLDDAIADASGRIARAALDGFGDRAGLIFTPGVKTAHAAAEALNGLRPGCAAAVDGEMDDDEKRRIEQAFKGGEIQIVANCGVYTEGFDYPQLMCILDAAPTKSRLRHAQKMGRGARPWPGTVDAAADLPGRLDAIARSPKPNYYVFDLACNSGSHALAGPVDLLAGRELPEVRERAAKLLQEHGGTVDDAVGEAKAAIEEERNRARAAARRAEQAARDRLVTSIGDPRTAAEVFGVKLKDETRRILRPEDHPTDRMLFAARQRRIPVPPNCSRGQLGRLLSADKGREEGGLTNYAQIREMATRGLDARTWSTVQWRAVHDAIAENGWRDLAPDAVDALLRRRRVGEEG